MGRRSPPATEIASSHVSSTSSSGLGKAEVAARAGEGEVGVGPAALLRREWGGVGGEDGEREAAGARIGSGRRGTGAGERDEGELAREREELAIAFICDGGAGRRGCRGSSAAVERAGEGAVGHRRRWSRGARVRWVVGGGGAGGGAGGARWRGGSGKGRGLWRGGITIEMEGD